LHFRRKIRARNLCDRIFLKKKSKKKGILENFPYKLWLVGVREPFAFEGLKSLCLPRAPVPQGRIFFKKHLVKFFRRGP